MVDPVIFYVWSVVAGDTIAGPYVRAACERHLRELEAFRAGRFPYRYDVDGAICAVEFYRDCLVYPDTESISPFELLPWAAFVVASLNGWKDSAGRSRWKLAYIETAKTSSKSPVAAGQALYRLVSGRGHNRQIYTAASSRQQAGVTFQDCRNMSMLSPVLSRELEINRHDIRYRGSVIKPLSSEAGASQGLRISLAVVDELAEHTTGDLMTILVAGQKSVPDSLILVTTNTPEDENGPCWGYHEHAIAVATGKTDDPRTFAYVCSVADGVDWETDERARFMANPGYPVLPPPENLDTRLELARNVPRERPDVARLNFCVRLGTATSFLDMSKYDALQEVLTLEDFAGLTVYGAFDCSSRVDTTAFSIAARREDGRVLTTSWVMLPESRLKAASRKERQPYPQWATDGYLLLCPGDTISYQDFADLIADVAAKVNIEECGYDPAMGGAAVAQLLDGKVNCVEAKSGQWLSEALKELEALVISGKLLPDDNPCVRSQMSNLRVKFNPNGRLSTWKHATSGRNDSAIANVMALDRMIKGDLAKPAVRYYESTPPVIVIGGVDDDYDSHDDF